ncbi:uncharacterized protein J4E88_001889 [Alternaria novae-zelandiae]|uniref:uncharacterized protein n=1 Tax=Alternaria novae-zelandiae TaxID=430562 RepID=UPI0020C564A9|nr:uncharacterized protein J4E88_001889 [Alternaria novae-zelandiae]KAI4693516.1 hypothetical protein J4E88_001889 [Alternaria novae-zelandiae]
MPYDRDVVVSCIERHYDLLVRMAYLDPDTILRPPPEGWSDEQLAVDTLQEWKRSDRVIDLLRHLPYLSKNMGDSKYEVYIVTEACNYLRNYGWLKDADKKKAIRHRSAPDDQFWRQAAKPREVQQYFDELYDEIETLVTVPVPLTRGSDAWYNEMVDHRDNNAKVSAILSANVTGRLIKQMNSYPSAC